MRTSFYTKGSLLKVDRPIDPDRSVKRTSYLPEQTEEFQMEALKKDYAVIPVSSDGYQVIGFPLERILSCWVN